MSVPYESATLILKLYELRRDATMREARAWYARGFNPMSADDVLQALSGPNSAHLRMVTSYWDMAASFVNRGAIDLEMFTDANGEQILIFAKIQPYLAEFRERSGMPHFLRPLETLLMQIPGIQTRLDATRERFRALAAAAAARQTTSK